MTKSHKLMTAFRNAMLSSATRKDQFAHFLDTMRSDPSFLELLADNYFDRECAKWKVEHVAGSNNIIATAPVHDRAVKAQTKIARDQRINSILKAAARSIVEMVTLEYIMPNGKRLRDCTFAEIRRFGGVFVEISKLGKGAQVLGHHINAKELAAVVSRHEKRVAA